MIFFGRILPWWKELEGVTLVVEGGPGATQHLFVAVSPPAPRHAQSDLRNSFEVLHSAAFLRRARPARATMDR